MMHNNNEKPIILVVVTFFLAITLVYIAFFRLQDPDPITNNDADLNIATGTWDMSGNILSGVLDEWITLWTQNNTWSISSGWTINKTGTALLTGLLAWNTSNANSSWKDKISKISGIKPWYGAIEIVQLLWLSVTDSFVDTWSIQYGYLGTWNMDWLANNVRRLWWNVLAIETENDIIKNALRWDRILFINIPQVTFVREPTEQKLLVAMIVTIDSDKRIIRAPVKSYYVAKWFMKSVFEQLYGKTL